MATEHWKVNQHPDDVGEPVVVRTYRKSNGLRSVKEYKKAWDFCPYIVEAIVQETNVLSKWEQHFQKKEITYTITRHWRNTQDGPYPYLKLWVPVFGLLEDCADEGIEV